MKRLAQPELLETLNHWRAEGTGLCVLNTMSQFVFGAGQIQEVSDQRISISLIKIVKRFEITPEDEVTQATFRPDDVVSAWHSTTFELKNPGLVGEHYDESLQLVVRGHVAGVSLYRATAFKRKRRESAG